MVRSVMPTTAADFRELLIARLATGLLSSISAMAALCAKHCRTKELGFGCFRAETIETSEPPKSPKDAGQLWPGDERRMNLAPGSPFVSPRLLLMALSQKAMAVFHMKSTTEEDKEAGKEDDEEEGVWKRQILMGERCQPPDFSGVIYYDHTGRRLQDHCSPISDGDNSAASYDIRDGRRPSLKVALRRPFGSKRALFAALNRKASSIFNRKKTTEEAEDIDEADGLWKRRILMGERCQPPDFSGAIYYDHTGKQLLELPPTSLASLCIPVVATQNTDLWR